MPIKFEDHIVPFGDDANIWRKMAFISKSIEIYGNKIISNHEIIITQHCLMHRIRSLYSERKGKLKPFSALKNLLEPVRSPYVKLTVLQLTGLVC